MAKKKLDPNNLSGPQKAAVFLLSMGEEYASRVFQKMGEDEIKRVASEMADIEQIPTDILNTVTEEFVGHYEREDRVDVRGEAFLKNVVSKSMDKKKAQAIYRELEDRKKETPFVWARDLDVGTLKLQIENEHPQTIAMIMAHLPPEIASSILIQMPDEKKGDIAMRVAQLNQVPEDIVREVDKTLIGQLSQMGGTGTEVGGVQTLVDILNNVDRSSEDIIMETIEEEHSDMANEIREMMFIFEDLSMVDDRGMREILKKVESQQLVLAMKTASEELKQKIVNNLSSRAAEMLMEDLEVMGPVRLAEVEEAQQTIIRAAKELEAEGTIMLGGKGKEDVLV